MGHADVMQQMSNVAHVVANMADVIAFAFVALS